MSKRVTIRNVFFLLAVVFAVVGCSIEDRKKEILIADLNLASGERTFEREFVVKYMGRYEVSFFFPAPLKGAKDSERRRLKVNGKLSGIVSILKKDGTILRDETFDWDFEYGFLGQTLFFIKSPWDVPKNEPLRCRVEFTEVGNTAPEWYDIVRIIIDWR